jgi:hypothetical protein
MKTVKFLIFTLVFALILIEITLRVVSSKKDHIVTLFNKRWYYLAPLDMPEHFPDVTKPSDPYRVYDADLGWSLGKHAASAPLYYSDAQGYRCSKAMYDSSIAQTGGAYDVVCIGDSFTHGDEVLYEETWPYYLAQSTQLSVLNLGVGGYGIDQAGLRYLKEKPKTKLVILGLVSGDLERACTQVYDLIGGGLKTKPVFSFEGDSIHIENTPTLFGDELKKQFQDPERSTFLSRESGYPQLFVSHWYDYSYFIRTIKTFPLWAKSKRSIYRTEDERLAYCLKILHYFKQETEKQGAEFRVLILDNMNTFEDWSKYGDPWILFRKKLEEQGILYYSNGNELERLYVSSRDSVINTGLVHYTPLANKRIATFLSRQPEIETLIKSK